MRSKLSVDETLAAMESLCDELEHQVGTAPEPRREISARTIAIGALLVALFMPPIIPVGDLIGIARAIRGPAVAFHESTLKTPTVRIGEPLKIHVKSEYLRVCSWKWVLDWHRADTGEAIATNWLPGSGHVIGVMSEYEFALNLPLGIQPGNYTLHHTATGECDHGDVAQIIDTDLAFTVTN